MILRIIKWYLEKYTDYELTVGSKPLKRFDKIFEDEGISVKTISTPEQIEKIKKLKRIYTIEQEPCNKCNATIKEQRQGCNEITCYRQHLKK